jgi:hypothetical protein
LIDPDIECLEKAADRLNGYHSLSVLPAPTKDNAPYEPAESTKDATLWLSQYHPERVEAWLRRHEPRLRTWLEAKKGRASRSAP